MNRIAIVGMSCRLPGANSPEQLWKMLCNGTNAVTDVPASRWNTNEFFDRDRAAPGCMYTIRGGFIDQIDLFDAACFGIAPREAMHMDPQQRLMLELAWEAFEDGNIPHQRLAGSATGVFIGFGAMEYALTQLRYPELIDAYTNTGYFPCIISNRISYAFDLRGPSMSLDTACSSSLVAVSLACESLRKRETNCALAGGVSLMVDPTTTVAFCKLSALSPNGRCKTFDAEADGYVRGEGGGLVLLKRYDDAIADGDRIYAVILGEAVNQDGRSNGMTAPNRQAQEEVLRNAYKAAQCLPSQVQYIEAHGTGTFLGDPIELSAIGNTMRHGRPKDRPLWIGSLKTNIGHLEAAAGVAGLIKLAKCIEHRTLPPHLNFETPNPHIPFEQYQTKIVTSKQPWPEHTGPLLAGISAFGFGGTNAHIVMGEPEQARPDVAIASAPEHPSILLLSARDPNALNALIDSYQSWLEEAPANESFDAVCGAVALGRSHLEYRVSVVAENRTAALTELARLPRRLRAKTHARSKIAFLYTGQGAQYVGMGKQLYDSEPVFQITIDQCNTWMGTRQDKSLREVMFADDSAGLIHQTQWTQPAMFALHWALTELWKSWGLEPSIILGHSIGEIAGACAAGMMSWEAGFHFAIERGAIMQSLKEPGGMLAVLASRSKVEELIRTHCLSLSIAASNAPENIVLSGPLDEIERAEAIAKANNIFSVRLNVSHAFHSALMEPALKDLLRSATAIKFQPSRVPFIANLTSELVPIGTTLAPAYFQAHALGEVRFEESIKELMNFQPNQIVEIGSGATLIDLAKRCMRSQPGAIAEFPMTPSILRAKDQRLTMLSALGVAYESGVAIKFDNVFGKIRRSIDLPKYPFQRTRFWESRPVRRNSAFADAPIATTPPIFHPVLGYRVDSPMVVFENQLSPSTPAWINDHQVAERVVLPGAGFVEMGLSTIRLSSSVTKDDSECHSGEMAPIYLSRVRFSRPMFLSDSKATKTQCVLHDHQIVISSKSDDASDRWMKHCTISTKPMRDAPSLPSDPIDLQSEISRCEQVVDTEVFYAALAWRGLQYGPAFRGIQQLWHNESCAWGEVEIESRFETEAYYFSPMALDSCFQVVACLLQSQTSLSDKSFVPSSIEHLCLRRSNSKKFFCRVHNIEMEDVSRLLADIDIFDSEGFQVGYIRRLRLVATSFEDIVVKAIQPTKAWQIRWDVNGNFGTDSGTSKTDSVLMLGYSERDVTTLARASLSVGGNDRIGSLDTFKELLCGKSGEAEIEVGTVLLAIGLDGAEVDDELVWEQLTQRCKALHHWLQHASQKNSIGRVVLLTHGAIAVGNAAQRMDLAGYALSGWLRSIRLEMPRWRCEHHDLDPSIEAGDQLTTLWDRIKHPSTELEVAWRDGIAWTRSLSHEASGHPSQLGVEQRSALTFSDKGSLDYLESIPSVRRYLMDDEVEIQVRSTGLNFRDVLNVLGMYPGDAGPLGGECAGVVTALGSKVTNHRVGDAVAAIVAGGFRDFAVAKAELVVSKPTGMTFAEASGLPIAVSTASIGLEHFGRISRGDRVLIHAAAGGVGLAAVRIALSAGAEVYATAGSERKRAMLLSMGVRLVANSRSQDFAAVIERTIGERGLDIVLNSLSGEFITNSLKLLRPGGRFVEIGKIGTWNASQVASQFADIEYTQFDLAEMAARNPGEIGEVLRRGLASYSNDRSRPQIHSVPFQNARDAFRWMSQGKHVGKLTISQPMHLQRTFPGLFEPESTYIVTGALGSIGKRLIPWMIGRGARNIEILMHRSLREDERLFLNSWSQNGVNLNCSTLALSCFESVSSKMDELRQSGVSIRGVFHLAGVLRDGLASVSSWQDFQEVLEAKGLAAWNLHRALRTNDLHYFVLFSSMASLIGSPGQANYATANAFLDALANHRRSQGLACNSIQWGPWAGAGMAQDFAVRGQQWGIPSLDSKSAFAALDKVLRGDELIVPVLDLNVDQFLQTVGRKIQLSFVQTEKDSERRDTESSGLKQMRLWKERIKTSDASSRKAIICEFLEEVASLVLGLPNGTTIDPRQPLREMGLDSLMAVEMKNILAEVTSISLDATVLFDHPTTESLASFLDQQFTMTSNRKQDPSRESTLEPQWNGSNATTDEIASELARELELLRTEDGR